MRCLPRRSALLLALCAIFVILGAPQAARADDSALTFDNTQCNKNVQSGLMYHAQLATAGYMSVATNAPYLDLKKMYCLQSLMDAFQSIGTIADPLGIVRSLITSLITSLLNQACSTVMQVISQVTQYFSSLGNLLCVPMPSMPSLGGINLGLKNATCNSISLLGVGTTSGMSPIPPGAFSYYGMQPGQSMGPGQ